MQQRINGYHKDSENHWVAELECGHGQHVRHDPPWTVREWVTTEQGRESQMGQELNCVRCDEMGIAIAQALTTGIKTLVIDRYTEAGISGLCEEGRIEVALGALDDLDLKALVEDALRLK